MGRHLKIDYVEFPSTDLAKTQAFFARVFGWTFTNFGSNYMAFSGAGIEGGFFSQRAAKPLPQWIRPDRILQQLP